MNTNDWYYNLTAEATQIKAELSILDYFFHLEKKSIIKFDGKHGKEYFFGFEQQKTGSISVNEQSNIWYDHSNGQGGDIIKAVQIFENKSFLQAVNVLKSTNITRTLSDTRASRLTKKISYKIEVVYDEVKHPALIRYITSRGLSQTALQGFVKEIHWSIGEKKYFAIGLKNENGGYAVRSAFFKGNINDSDISVLHVGNTPNAVKIFEGLIDFGSYRTLYKKDMFIAVVLNSTANLSAVVLSKINSLAIEFPIHIYLDNDAEGRNATKKISRAVVKAEDMMHLHPTPHGSDLNDYLLAFV